MKEALEYCYAHYEYMWASKVGALLLNIPDFRDFKMEYEKMKEQEARQSYHRYHIHALSYHEAKGRDPSLPKNMNDYIVTLTRQNDVELKYTEYFHMMDTLILYTDKELVVYPDFVDYRGCEPITEYGDPTIKYNT